MFTVYAILIVLMVLLSLVTFNGRSPLLVENAPMRKFVGEYVPSIITIALVTALIVLFAGTLGTLSEPIALSIAGKIFAGVGLSFTPLILMSEITIPTGICIVH